MNHVSRTIGIVKASLIDLRARERPLSDKGVIGLIDYLDALQTEVERLEGGNRANAEFGPNIIPFPVWKFPHHSSEEIA